MKKMIKKKNTTRGEVKNSLKNSKKDKTGRMSDIRMLGKEPRVRRNSESGKGLAKWKRR